MPKDCTEISVPARLDALPGLLEQIDYAAGDLGQEARQRVRIVVEELFLNAIHHGGTSDCREDIAISILRQGAVVTLVYRDDGPPFDPTVPGAARADDTIGGFGLMLIRELAQEIRYRRANGSNCIELDFVVNG